MGGGPVRQVRKPTQAMAVVQVRGGSEEQGLGERGRLHVVRQASLISEIHLPRVEHPRHDRAMGLPVEMPYGEI